MADSGESFHSSPDETSKLLPLEPQQEAHNSPTSLRKNKPLPLVIIPREIDLTIKNVRIEVPYGHDIIEMIETFARHHRVGVNIENRTGHIRNFAFRNTRFMSSGVFGLRMMTGTFMDNSFIDTLSSTSTGGALLPLPYSGPWLRVVCEGTEEKLFGGIVAEKVMAYSKVVVVYATTFKSCRIQVLDPAEYASKGQQPVQHVGGLFGGSSGPSTHPSGGRLGVVGDSAGGRLDGGGNSGVLGGGTQQQNWGFPMWQQPVQHRGGHFGRSSNLSTHPRGGGLGGVGDFAGGLLGGGGGNSGVLGGGTQQQNRGFPIQQQFVHHRGGHFGGSSGLSTLLGGGGLDDSNGGLVGGGGNSAVLGGGVGFNVPTQQQNWGFLMMEQQPVQHGGGQFGGSSSLSTHPSGGGVSGVGDSANRLQGGGGNGGVSGGGDGFDVPTEQVNWDFPTKNMRPPSYFG